MHLVSSAREKNKLSNPGICFLMMYALVGKGGCGLYVGWLMFDASLIFIQLSNKLHNKTCVLQLVLKLFNDASFNY